MSYSYRFEQQRQLLATLMLALGAAAGFWVFDGTVDLLLFRENDWEESWLPRDAMEMWMRLLLMLFVATFVFYSRYTSLTHLKRVAAMDRRIRLISRAMEQSDDAIAIFDAKGRIEYLNSAFRNLIGLDDDLSGDLTKQILYPFGWYRSLRERLDQVGRNAQPWRGRMELTDTGGRVIPVIAMLSPVDGGAGFHYYVVTMHNIDDYEQLQSRLHEVEKMEAVGVLASGMAHDFNNMFSGIQGNGFLIAEDADRESEIFRRAHSIMELCDKGAGMIQHLLVFARKDLVHFERENLTELLWEIHGLATSLLPANVQLTLSLPEQPIHVSMDSRQVQLALMNLVLNARDAVEGEAEAQVGLTLAVCAKGDALLQRHDMDGNYVCLSVHDNGIGIEQGAEERIFEPFFSTKEVGKGTGLGLALVYGAAQRHDGVAGFERREKGSHFYMLLPAGDDESQDVEIV